MTGESFGKRMRQARKKLSWSQAKLGKKLGVSQGAVYNWEAEIVVPNQDKQRKICELLGLGKTDAEVKDQGATAGQRTEEGPSAFGDWLNRARVEKGLSVAELATKAGVSVPAIYGIESGRIENPRPRTVLRLEKALGKVLPKETKEEIREEATVEGMGEFFEFDPHDRNEWPDAPGIYVFYDISDRPIYVGQGSSIKQRIQDHEEKFWFKSPIVFTAAYIQVDDGSLRKKIENILIRFLKRNAVINKQNVER